MQSRENLLLYVSLFGVPVAPPSTVSLHPSSPYDRSHRLSNLYLIQLAGSADHDESFLFDPPFLFVSFSLFPLPVYRSLPPPCSFLSSPTPIYPIPSFTFSLDRSFSLRFTANVRFIRSIKGSLILFFKPFLF